MGYQRIFTGNQIIMTEQDKKDYLENPFHCPFCKKGNIDADHIETTYNGAYQSVRCPDCKKRWNDMYELTDMEEIE